LLGENSRDLKYCALELKKELLRNSVASRGDDHNGDLVMLFGFLWASSPQPLRNEACSHHKSAGAVTQASSEQCLETATVMACC
jgi:hypothetical protein